MPRICSIERYSSIINEKVNLNSNNWQFKFVILTETEPSDRETDIWKELQVTRMALSRAEDELRQSRTEKDDFLNSLSRIAVNI